MSSMIAILRGDLLHRLDGLLDGAAALGGLGRGLARRCPSVTLALSLFWLTLAAICSMLALVSSTLAACSVAAWDSDCEAPVIWLDGVGELVGGRDDLADGLGELGDGVVGGLAQVLELARGTRW